MPSEQNFDDFIRRKEREAQPDLSLQQQHWKELKATQKGARVTRLRTLLAAAALIAVAVLLGIRYQAALTGSSGRQSAGIEPKSSPAALTPSLPDVPHSIATQVKQYPFFSGAAPSHGRAIARDKTTSATPGLRPTAALPHDDTSVAVAKSEVPDSKAVFEAFFAALQKAPQVFYIDGGRDTTLLCNEGTELTIEAGVFEDTRGQRVHGPAVVQVQEFYSIADILGNKLSTTSGDQILETGGMLQINASAGNSILSIRPGASIGLKMPAPRFNPMMQLFTATGKETTPVTGNAPIDSSDARSNLMNWIPAGQRQAFFANKHKLVPLLNLMDEPVRVAQRHPNNPSKSRSIATFTIPSHVQQSTAEIKALLQARYGKYYDVIKVRREWKALWRKNRSHYRDWEDWYDTQVGDSMQMPIGLAMRLKYITREDSLRYEAQWQQQVEEAIRQNAAAREILEKSPYYRFSLDKLGWINCDHFMNYPKGRLTEFIVRSGEAFDPSLVQAFLLFRDENVALGCTWKKNKLVTPKIPLGKEVSIVCLVVKEGKAFVAVKDFTVSRNPAEGLQFTETTPEAFRQMLRRFGTVGTRG